MPKISKKTTRRRTIRKSALPTVEAFLAESNQRGCDQAALELLVKIVRGEQIELCDNEMKPASLSQRIAAAQILLKMREREVPAPTSPTATHVHPIDAPDRAHNYDEWLARQKRVHDHGTSPSA